MVEVMADKRGECDWSPDMELDSCDAEKAATLLLSVAPRCRSQNIPNGGGSPSSEGVGIYGHMPTHTIDSGAAAFMAIDDPG
ncbi:unnamed protein product, partial [Discosporangium mesarthrocarpum]